MDEGIKLAREKGLIHGLYRRRKAIIEPDRRTRQAKAWQTFIQGVMDDLGEDLSFAQRALAETAFLKFFVLSDAVRLLGRKKNRALNLFFNKRMNTAFNCTSNSFRLDMIALYGPKGLKRLEQKLPSLEQYLKAKEAGMQEGSKSDDPGEK